IIETENSNKAISTFTLSNKYYKIEPIAKILNIGETKIPSEAIHPVLYFCGAGGASNEKSNFGGGGGGLVAKLPVSGSDTIVIMDKMEVNTTGVIHMYQDPQRINQILMS